MPALLAPMPKQRFFTNANLPAAGYKLYTYAANTTNLLATYTSRAGNVANPNPITLDANGECVIYLPSGQVYDFKLERPDGVQEWLREDVEADPTANDLASTDPTKGAALATYVPRGTNAQVRNVFAKLRDLDPHLFDFVSAGQHATILAGTSTYDAGTELTRLIAEATSTGRVSPTARLPRGLVNFSSTHLITSPVHLKGAGCGAPGYSTFPTELGTRLKYVGADTNAELFRFNNINYGGVGMSRVYVDGNGVAKRGVILDAVLGFDSDELAVARCTNVLLGLISTGETTSWNNFRSTFLLGEIDGTAGSTCLWLSGGNGTAGAGSNAAHNNFIGLHINHGGLRSGIYLGGVDNCVFINPYIYRDSGTRPGVEVVHEQQGGVWFPVANTFVNLQAGTGGWVEPAGGNATFPTACIYGYQTDNGQPLPVTNGRRLPYTTNSGDMVGIRSIGRTSYGTDWAGSVSATSGTSTTTVTFSAARSSAAYIVVLNAPTTLAWSIQNKTATGFQIVWSGALPSTYSVDWLIIGA